MWTNVQFIGTLAPNQTQRWFTFGWPASWHVVWYMVPTTVMLGNPSIDWDVAVERADTNNCTYWLTVKNLSGSTVTFEGRYAVLA
jgi:hypothetical protein